MKNKILLFIAIITSSFSFAQTPSFGVKAGVAFSGMHGDVVDNFKNLLDFTDGRITTKDYTGFFAGGFATLPLSENISIEPGVYYSQKGYELNGALNVKGRLFHHRKGKGSRFLAAANSLGIDYDVVREWPGDKQFERQLKNRKCAPRYCPICRKNH